MSNAIGKRLIRPVTTSIGSHLVKNGTEPRRHGRFDFGAKIGVESESMPATRHGRAGASRNGRSIMASISTAINGTRRILFVNKEGGRKAVHLGKISLRTTEEICRRVETINAAAIAAHTLDGDTAAWLSKIGGSLHERLAAAGLVEARS